MPIIIQFDEFMYVFDNVDQASIQEESKKIAVWKGERNFFGLKVWEHEEEVVYHLQIRGKMKSSPVTTWSVSYSDAKKAIKNLQTVFEQIKKQTPNIVDEAFENTILKG